MSAEWPRQPVPSPRSGPHWGTVIAWLGILGVVGVVAVRVWIMSHDVRMEEAGDDVTLQIAARNTVGYHILTQTAGRQAVPVSKLRELTASVVNQAHTPKQRLGAVTVIGEVLGAPAALDELDRLKGTLGSPGLRAASHTLRTIYESGPTVVTGDQALGLVKQLGWQGKLALSFQLPAEEARRAKILSTSLRAFAATLGLELVIGLALLTGVALLTLGIVKGVDGKLTLAYRPNPGPAGPFLEAFAIYLVSYVGVGYFAAKVHLKPEWLVYLIELAFVAFAACWPLFRGTSILQLREGLGWHSGRGVVREALAGLGAYIAGLPLMVAAIAVTVLLSKVAGEKPIHPIVFGAGGAGWGAIIGLYLLASVWAPVVEETMFRGALFNHLRAGHRWLFSGVISSLIFAALHPQGWTAIPVLATIGFIFAATREWRGTVIASGVAHALNNAVATTMLVLVLA